MSSPSVSRREAARSVAATRVLAGTVMVIRPTWLARSLGVDRLTAQRTAWVSTMIGGRDLVLGVGALLALIAGRDDDAALRTWLLAAAAADAIDVWGIGRAARRGFVSRPAAIAVVASALAASTIGVRSSCRK